MGVKYVKTSLAVQHKKHKKLRFQQASGLQTLVCVAPKSWSKYTTLGYRRQKCSIQVSSCAITGGKKQGAGGYVYARPLGISTKKNLTFIFLHYWVLFGIPPPSSEKPSKFAIPFKKIPAGTHKAALECFIFWSGQGPNQNEAARKSKRENLERGQARVHPVQAWVRDQDLGQDLERRNAGTNAIIFSILQNFTGMVPSAQTLMPKWLFTRWPKILRLGVDY